MHRFIRRLAIGRRRWRRRQEGAAAVEFALVALPFFWVFMGIIELAMLMLFNNGLEHGVESAGRLIRTGQAQTMGLDAGAFRTEVCKRVMISSNCSSGLLLDVRRFPDFASISGLESPTSDGSQDMTLNERFDPGGPREVVVVRTYYEWKFFTPMLGALLDNTGRNTFLVGAATTFRNEPYANY